MRQWLFVSVELGFKFLGGRDLLLLISVSPTVPCLAQRAVVVNVT